MTFIRIKDSKAPNSQMVYQGYAEVVCECIFEEQQVMLWASDPTFKHGSLPIFLTADEATQIAKQLLHHSATIQSGVPDE